MIKVDGLQVEPTIFPDRTSQVWQLPDVILKKDKVEVEWEFQGESEFIHLAQLKMLLDKHSIISSLEMKYLPYARQDKKIDNNVTFALHTFAKLLNSLNFETVKVTDPHSEVAKQLIKNFCSIMPYYNISKAYEVTKSDMVCYPDKNAAQKYSMAFNKKFVYGNKIRNQQTGEITKYELIGDPKGKRILIVDDLCDGGGTFINVAKILYKKGAKEVSLYTTHGIYSKGLKPIKKSGIKRIFNHNGEMTEFQDNLVISSYEMLK